MSKAAERGIQATIWTFAGIDVALTAGRYYIRRTRTSKRLRWDDFLHGVALVCLIALSAVSSYELPAVFNVLGFQPEESVPTDAQVLKYIKLNMVQNMLFPTVLFSVRLSFLAMYWNIFQLVDSFRIAWYCVTTYICVAFLATLLCNLWICGSPSQLINLAACESDAAYTVFYNVNIVWCALIISSDVLTIALPLGMLHHLRLSFAQKVGLVIVFCLGFVDIVFDVLRTVYSISTTESWQVLFLYFEQLEPAIAVLLSALPPYQSLLKSGLANVASKGRSLVGASQNASRAQSRTGSRSHSRAGSRALGRSSERQGSDEKGATFSSSGSWYSKDQTPRFNAAAPPIDRKMSYIETLESPRPPEVFSPLELLPATQEWPMTPQAEDEEAALGRSKSATSRSQMTVAQNSELSEAPAALSQSSVVPIIAQPTPRRARSNSSRMLPRHEQPVWPTGPSLSDDSA